MFETFPPSTPRMFLSRPRRRPSSSSLSRRVVLRRLARVVSRGRPAAPCRSTASGTIETDDRSRPVVYPPGISRAFRDRADARARASSRRDRVVDEGTARARQLDARTIVMLGARAMTSTSTVRVAADAGTARERGTMKIARAPGRHAMARGREDGRGARATRGARVVASAGGAKIKVIGCGGGGGNAVNRMIESGLQVRQTDWTTRRREGARRETRAREDGVRWIVRRAWVDGSR